MVRLFLHKQKMFIAVGKLSWRNDTFKDKKASFCVEYCFFLLGFVHRNILVKLKIANESLKDAIVTEHLHNFGILA